MLIHADPRTRQNCAHDVVSPIDFSANTLKSELASIQSS